MTCEFQYLGRMSEVKSILGAWSWPYEGVVITWGMVRVLC